MVQEASAYLPAINGNCLDQLSLKKPSIGIGDIIYQGCSPEEVQVFAQLKRFFERCKGDPEFREMVWNTPAEHSGLLKSLGIVIDPAELKCVCANLQGAGSANPEDDSCTTSPLLKQWADWQAVSQERLRRLYEGWGRSHNSRWNAWRSRQLHRNASEAGKIRRTPYFPLFAYELSKGCSIGCWFCGFDATKLAGNFTFTKENAQLWQELLSIGNELFGQPAKLAFCYHGTEPFDNPDYLSFLKSFHSEYGVYPQTTTAAPLRNLEQTRKLLQLRETAPQIPDRFSVLSLAMLKRIHETFSPYELRYVQLALHNKEASKYKSNCGRARKNPDQLLEANRAADQCYSEGNSLDPFSTACVCGYLVNMVERSVKLVSPCMANDQWPNGYYIYAEETFRDSAEYRAFLERTIEEFMAEQLEWKHPVAFRSDLKYKRRADGFSLTSRACRNSLKGKPWYGTLGDQIDAGESTAGEIITTIAADGVSLPEVSSAIQNIFAKGLLEEDPALRRK